MENNHLKIALIREGKIPPDERVALGPIESRNLNNAFPCDVVIQESKVRRIPVEAYQKEGVHLVDTVNDADILIGVKEVPIDQLLENKTYFFFSHTIKEQPYNKDLLKAILKKNIRLIDYECLTDENGIRLLGFGRFAGIVGAYNGFRMMGLKTGRFNIKSAHSCTDLSDLLLELKKVKLGPIKICITGRGRVAKGAIEILEVLGIEGVSVDSYLNEEFNEAVYTQLAVTEYNKRIDGEEGNVQEFFKDPSGYVSDFNRFLKVTEYYIACHYWDAHAPYLFTEDELKDESFKVKYIADISCDIDGPIPTTIRPSTIEEPFYGIRPSNKAEMDFMDPESIAVMAVDNLPCELPVDASVDFGHQLMKHVLPHLFNGDKNNVLERATIARDGKLTDRYAYLHEYVEKG